jgi:hypothetical protein
MFLELWRIKLIAFACALLAIAAGSTEGAQRISKENAISIAAVEARQHWYEPDKLIIDADERNSAWETFLAAFQKSEPNALREPPLADLLNKLAGKTYWAVKFSPRAAANVDVFDGTAWIFVDAYSGVVLSVLGNSVRRTGG